MLSKLLRLYMVKPNLNPSSLAPEPILLNHRLFCHLVAKAKLSLVVISMYVLSWHNCLCFLIEENIYLDILMEDNPFMICICIWTIMIFYIILDRCVWSSNSHKYMEPSHKGLSQVEVGNYLSLFIICLSLKLQIACFDFFQQIISVV